MDRSVNLSTGEMLTLTPNSNSSSQESGELAHPPEMPAEESAIPEQVPGQEDSDLDAQEPLPDNLPSTSTPIEVRLLTATRIPSGYQKMVRGKVEKRMCNETSLFTPVRMENGLQMTDCVVDLKDDCCMVLVVQNHGATPVKLKKGCVLGDMVPVTEHLPSEGGQTDSPKVAPPTKEVCVCDLTVEADSTTRKSALLQ